MPSRLLRLAATTAGLIAAWQALVLATGVPRFILPAPASVATALWERRDILLANAAITLGETVLGMLAGTLLGAASALAVAASPTARRWLLPVLVASQAVPVFALAPLLVLWLGYGILSKIAMAALIIFFPVAVAFTDGLRRTDPGLLDLARTMGASRWDEMRHVRVPAALPAFGSGLRVAAAVAPIGAVIGEWVGSSAGLGYLMLHANGRMQTDLLFAALLVLATMTLTLYFAVDAGLRRALPWQPDAAPASP
ncbi:MAG: ABC transporter permease [Alphaproteobacteria bacterium]|nr:ABC transporter permease [Alphaproteobacteria bacterium]